MKAIITALILMIVSGCAAYTSRFMENPTTLYPATRLDVFAVCCLFEDDRLNGFQWLVPLPVVDLVPSLATDTLLLPYDGIMLWRSNHK